MSTVPRERISVQVRWMVRRDMSDVVRIEHLSYEFPWCEEDFLRCLRQRNCIGTVAERDEHVMGYIVYELHWDSLHILKMAVHPDYRRRGVGTQLVQKVISKLENTRRNRVALEVPESNLEAQLFFRSCGFRATRVLRAFYSDTEEDAYHFEYRLAPSGLTAEPSKRAQAS
jgi:ribosomal-protein-alanine N-acetyltransferase